MNAKNAVKSIIKNLFPETCAGCNNRLSHENLLCADCMYSLPITDHHKLENNRFTNHFLGRVKIEKGGAYLNIRKEGAVQEIMHKLQYGGKYFIGVFLGKMAGKRIGEVNYMNDIDIIVPAPLHKVKESIRGYNQCEAFAQGLSEYSNVPYSLDILLKIKNNITKK